MAKEYDTFICGNDRIPIDQECRIIIRDLAPGKYKYQSREVRAVVSNSAELLPEGETLWVRTELGRLFKEPLRIKIIE